MAVSQVALSPGGDELVLGLGTAGEWDTVRADAMLAVETATWTQSMEVPVSPFWTFAVATDGRAITLERDSGRVEAVDLERDVDLGPMGFVGDLPQAIVTAP